MLARKDNESCTKLFESLFYTIALEPEDANAGVVVWIRSSWKYKSIYKSRKVLETGTLLR